MKDNIIDSRGGSRRDSNFNKLIISDKGLNLTSNPTVEVGRIHILAAMHASYCLNSPREHSRQRSQPAELQQNTPSTAMNDEVPLLSTLKSRAIKTTIRKCPEYNLFRSRGQILPVEVNLKIIESVVALNPDVVGILRCLSKSFHGLLKNYEYSIVRNVTPKCQNIGYQVLPSCCQPENIRIPSMSYKWLSELTFRNIVISHLMRHDLTRIDIDGSLPKVEKFKHTAFQLLYQLADSTVGVKSFHSARVTQVEFLEQLDLLELATLGVLMKALGMGYFRMSRTSLGLLNPSLIRECMCVFEDKMLRYGPFLAWAAVAGTPKDHMWFALVVQDGLDELRAFEAGQLEAYSSLQSVLWHLFCDKDNCTLTDSWNRALDIIENDVASYKD